MFFLSYFIFYLIAKLSPAQQWAEVALVPIDPATHPPAGKVDTSLRYKSNYV